MDTVISPRRTRLQRKQLTQDHPAEASKHHSDPQVLHPLTQPLTRLTQSITNLTKPDHALLLRKQSLLRQTTLSPTTPALAATLVFAQYEAGTAVCIAPNGLLLTCAHCIAETPESFSPTNPHWLLFASGTAVSTLCIAWDPKRDLALMQVTHSQLSGPLPFVELADAAPKLGTKLLCIGHPGSEDLESDVPGAKTGYDVLHVSEGRFRGLAKGQDVQDNEEIGALQHDCWTYWGHSGAPLINRETGKLVGLHSSWDDDTCMRRGVAWEAVKAFLDEHGGGEKS